MAQSVKLQDALDMARQDPESDFANKLRVAIESGQLDESAQKQGVDLSRFGRPVETPGILSRIFSDIPSDIKETGQAIGSTVQEGFDTTTQAREQVASGEITRGAGAIKAGGATAKALITAPFEAILGLAKLPFTPEAESKVANVVKDIATGLGEEVSDQNKAFMDELRADAMNNGGNAQRILDGINSLAEKYKTDETFKAYVDGAGDFAIAGVEALGLKSANRVRKLAPEIDIPYFRDIETSVADAISNVRTVSDKAKVGTASQANTATSIAVNDLSQRGVADAVIDTALAGAQKTVQTYRDLVDSAQTRIVRNLDNQAIRENASLPIKDVEQNIQKMYVNAVSPGVKGKRVTTEGIIANKTQAVEAIKGLTVKKSNLTFRDVETNQIVTGELPSNLWEFGGAVTDQKSKVYKEVLEKIGKAADEPVDTSRIADAMMDIIENPVYAGETSIINRARQALEKYSLTDYTPLQLEDLIKLENDKLQAFYRGSGSQGDAIVSALVANNLRDMLDEAVEAATGSGVRELKRDYGNLKAIERDVVHRALHNAQARDAGLVDMFGIRTIGDVSAGLAGDIGALRRGAGQIVGEGFIKALNDRDAMINRMFMVADQAYTTP